jgi:ferredoxin
VYDGIALCESLSPGHFQVNDDGDLVLLRPDVTSGELATVQVAVRSVPKLP